MNAKPIIIPGPIGKDLSEVDMTRPKPTCATCKWWGNRESYRFCDIEGVKECGYALMPYNVSEWDDDRERRVLSPEYADRLAFVQDGSDYTASLLTMPSFGCVAHAPKDKP